MAALFTSPAEWPTARARVDVFKFYEQQLLEPPDTPRLGPDHYTALRDAGAFSTLTLEWHKAIAIEVGAVKRQFCSPNGTAEAEASRQSIDAVLNVRMAGGRVAYLAMDEPFYAGVTDADVCGGATGAADRLLVYVTAVRHALPGIGIGLIEPYPYFQPESIAQFLDLMAARGIAPSFLHLDAGTNQLRAGRDDFVRDVGAIAFACAARGVRFGMIFNGDTGESNAAYASGVMTRVQLTRQLFGSWAQMPGDLVFQSWVDSPTLGSTIPQNLPETLADTHTDLILRGLAGLGAPGL
jgi:hypothetical protein